MTRFQRETQTMANQTLSQNDQALIEILRARPELTIGDLVEVMGVTATAVRQRLTRLMAMELICRSQVTEGRGRPSHHYSLTAEGRQTAGNNLGDLAVVLWQEVQEIPDREMRQRVIAGVVDRLADKYQGTVYGETVEDRMNSISEFFAERKIPISVEQKDGLPIIKVSGCPYPTLAANSREICDMEHRLLEKIVGRSLDLYECEQDGDRCCSFQFAENDMEKQPAI